MAPAARSTMNGSVGVGPGPGDWDAACFPPSRLYGAASSRPSLPFSGFIILLYEKQQIDHFIQFSCSLANNAVSR